MVNFFKRSRSKTLVKQTLKKPRPTSEMRTIVKKKGPVEIYKAKDDRVIPELTRKYGPPIDEYFEKNKPVVVFSDRNGNKAYVKLKYQHTGIMVIHSDGRLDHKYSTPFARRITPGQAVSQRRLLNRQIENGGNSKQFKISWVRHGVSCANITEVYKKIFTTVGDTPLFEGATLGACYLNKFNRGSGSDLPYAYEAGFVFCSQMLRAIQTAILMFPDKFLEGKILVVSGINEFGITGGNKPQKWNDTLKDLKLWYKTTRKNLNRIYQNPGFCEEAFELFDSQFDTCADKIFDLFRHNKVKKYKNKCMPENDVVPDIIDYLFLPEVYKKPNGEIHEGFGFLNRSKYFDVPDNITIVSHSNYIKNNIMSKQFLKKLMRNKQMPSKSNGKVYNNGIYVKFYKVRSFYSETERRLLKRGILEKKDISERIVSQGCLHNKKTKKINCFKSLSEYDKAKAKDDTKFNLNMSIPLEYSTSTCRKKNTERLSDSISPIRTRSVSRERSRTRSVSRERSRSVSRTRSRSRSVSRERSRSVSRTRSRSRSVSRAPSRSLKRRTTILR